jgi:hypothetical protein
MKVVHIRDGMSQEFQLLDAPLSKPLSARSEPQRVVR